MLVWDANAQRYDADLTPSHGTQTLFDAYDEWLKGEAIQSVATTPVFKL
jgi:divinyl chlorophyllide a 8-vinyl-reductase